MKLIRNHFGLTEDITVLIEKHVYEKVPIGLIYLYKRHLFPFLKTPENLRADIIMQLLIGVFPKSEYLQDYALMLSNVINLGLYDLDTQISVLCNLSLVNENDRALELFRNLRFTEKEIADIICGKLLSFPFLQFFWKQAGYVPTLEDIDYIYHSHGPRGLTLIDNNLLPEPWYNSDRVGTHVKFLYTKQKGLDICLDIFGVFQNPEIVVGNKIIRIDYESIPSIIVDFAKLVWNDYKTFRQRKTFILENLADKEAAFFGEYIRVYELIFRRARISAKKLKKLGNKISLINKIPVEILDLPEKQALTYLKRFMLLGKLVKSSIPMLENRRISRLLCKNCSYWDHQMNYDPKYLEVPENVILVWRIIKNQIGTENMRFCNEEYFNTHNLVSVYFLILIGYSSYITREIMEFTDDDSRAIMKIAGLTCPDIYILLHDYYQNTTRVNHFYDAVE